MLHLKGRGRLCHCKSASLILFLTLISSPGAPCASGTRPCFGFLMVDERAEMSSAQHGALQTGVCRRSCRRCCVRGSSCATHFSARCIHEVAATRGGSVCFIYGGVFFKRAQTACCWLHCVNTLSKLFSDTAQQLRKKRRGEVCSKSQETK